LDFGVNQKGEPIHDPSYLLRLRDGFAGLACVMTRLRSECPWDRVQTPETLKKYVLEEAYEVIEAIETLKGRGPSDTEELTVVLTARMLVLAGLAATSDEASGRVRRALETGEGLECSRLVIEAQVTAGDTAPPDFDALALDEAGELTVNPIA